MINAYYVVSRTTLLNSIWPKENSMICSSVVQPSELPSQLHVEQRFFHRRVRQAEPFMEEVDAQHCLDRKRGERPRLPSGAYGGANIIRSG